MWPRVIAGVVGIFLGINGYRSLALINKDSSASRIVRSLSLISKNVARNQGLMRLISQPKFGCTNMMNISIQETSTIMSIIRNSSLKLVRVLETGENPGYDGGQILTSARASPGDLLLGVA